MKFFLRYLFAIIVSTILTALTILSLGVINYIFVGEIPMDGTILATIITFALYSLVTCLIAYLTIPVKKIKLPKKQVGSKVSV